jgi:hypothetical protein
MMPGDKRSMASSECASALNADERGVQPLSARGVVLGGRAHDSRRGLGRLQERAQLAQIFEEFCLAIAGIAERIGGDDPGRAVDTALARPGQVELAHHHAAREGSVPSPEVIA